MGGLGINGIDCNVWVRDPVVAVATACASGLDLNMQDVGTGRSQRGGARKEQEL